MNRNIIVIGASAGGFEALKTIISSLHNDLQASIFIVWHMAPQVKGILPQVLTSKGELVCTHARDGEAIQPGHIYVAPPDHHLMIDQNRMYVTHGPKENRFRPAVDPLFRSAAFAYGPQVIGIILSGALDDGTAGLWLIKQYGGIAIVQDPDDAEVSSMPSSAIRSVDVDHVLPVSHIGPLIARLSKEEFTPDPVLVVPQEIERTKTEIGIAMENKGFQKNLELSQFTTYTCPECHGVLSSIKEGDRVRFRCHTGHAFSSDSLLSSLTESIEESLWTAIRGLQESVFLLNELGDHFSEVNEPKVAALYFKKAQAAQHRVGLVKEAVYSHEQLSFNEIEKESQGTE